MLFRHPDGCRWLWQARFDVYFSLFELESSGSHATASHLIWKKTTNHFSQFETADRQRGGEYLLKVRFQQGWLSYKCHSYRSLRFNTPINYKINPLYTTISPLYHSNYLDLIQQFTCLFTTFICSPGKIYVIGSIFTEWYCPSCTILQVVK